jgi:hypothetical protein
MKFALALIVTLLAAFPALASPCMTHSEAKHVYGRDTYLHWTGNHCWGVRHESSRRTVHKESAPLVRATHNSGERLPIDKAAGGADAVWPASPPALTWADRWPEERKVIPEMWFLDLMQFGERSQ